MNIVSHRCWNSLSIKLQLPFPGDISKNTQQAQERRIYISIYDFYALCYGNGYDSDLLPRIGHSESRKFSWADQLDIAYKLKARDL